MLIEGLRCQLEEFARAVAREEGVDVWDVQLWRDPRGWKIKVILDNPEGAVGVEVCGRVNRSLRGRLELEGTLPGDFDMEVSSPGLDRPLRNEAEVVRFRGCLAKFKVRGELHPETVVGRILGVNDGVVEVDTETGRRRIPYAAVAEARLEPELPGFEKKAPRGKKNKAPRR